MQNMPNATDSVRVGDSEIGDDESGRWMVMEKCVVGRSVV